MLVAAALLVGPSRGNLNMRGAFLHVTTDLAAFAGTAVAGAIVLATGWNQADPIASLLVAILIFWSSFTLLRESTRILLEVAPEEPGQIARAMLEVPQVSDVHDLHVWTVTSGLPALSVHVVITEECFTAGRAPALLDELQACLAGHFDVEHSTFQLEPAGHSDHEPALH